MTQLADDMTPSLLDDRLTAGGPAGVPAPRRSLAARPSATITLTAERRDARTGALLRELTVTDLSDASPTRDERQSDVAALDARLLANPHWTAPDAAPGMLAVRNPVSASIYSSPAMAQWRSELVPTARALFPMQCPGATHLPSGLLIDDIARSYFTDTLDAIGIRTRAAIMRQVVTAVSADRPVGARPLWVSLACGAAIPVLDAASDAASDVASDVARSTSASYASPELVLVDIDPEALAFADGLARQAGLTRDRDYRLMHQDLVRTMIARPTLVEELGAGSASLVEALGIFEYLSDAACVRLLSNAWSLVGAGGVLVVANMLDDRRELAFNQRGIGWPDLNPRSVSDLLDLAARAGLPLGQVTISIPQDRVYAVLSVTR